MISKCMHSFKSTVTSTYQKRWSLSGNAPWVDFWANSEQTRQSIHPVHKTWHCQYGPGSGQEAIQSVPAASETSSLSPKTQQEKSA